MSNEANKQAVEIIQALRLRGRLSADTVDNLLGRIATACDVAWKQGYADAEMEQRLKSMGLGAK